jgi:acetyl esterase/lipase
MPGFMSDAASAGQWAAAHAGEYDADPSRLYLMGHSAGAHMAALVTLDPRYFAAGALSGVAAHQFRAVRRAADAVGAWLDGRHRGRAPTLADIEAFVRQPRSEDRDQAALAAAGAAIA